MRVSSSLPNLINGVSQQPFALRLASQMEEQDNFDPTPVEGLRRRNPTSFVTKFPVDDFEDSFIHPINRDGQERYFVQIQQGKISVFDLDGTPKAINTPDGLGYLNTGPENYRAVTVADFTFIVNTTYKPNMNTSFVSTVREPEALVHIKVGNYGRNYQVFIDGLVVGSYKTPDGDQPSDAQKIDTDLIARKLKESLELNLSASEWRVQRVASTLRIENLLGNDFNIYTEDGTGGNGSTTIKDKVQRFTDLPRAAFKFFDVEVVGDNTSSFDNYYVKYDTPGQSKDTDGVWTETVKPGTVTRIFRGTMPHALVREADGSFTFREIEWNDRIVGDEDSAPDPSFIGRPINDVFFYRNRLGFLAGENVILSEAGDFFNFFPKTVTTITDSQPIDVAASHTRVAILKHAVSYDEKLLLFSNDTQFVLDGGNLLTPQSVQITQTTDFESDTSVKPKALGTKVYFPTIQGKFSAIREYSTANDIDTKEAVDVTAHVPRLVPSSIKQMEGSSNLNMLVVLSEDTPNKLYVYRYFFSGREKLQSAWSTWSFAEGDEIMGFAIFDTDLYLIVKRFDGTYLDKMPLESSARDEGSELTYYVDRKIYETDLRQIIYDPSLKRSTLYLPYRELDAMWVFARAGDSQQPEGRAYKVHGRPSNSTIWVNEDLRGRKLCIGRAYSSQFTFSPFILREEARGGGQVAVGGGRLQITKTRIDHSDTGYYRALVSVAGRGTFVYYFNGRTVGTDLIGEYTLETGTFEFPVFTQNTQASIQIETNGYLPATFMAAEWEGTFHPKSRRL